MEMRKNEKPWKVLDAQSMHVAVGVCSPCIANTCDTLSGASDRPTAIQYRPTVCQFIQLRLLAPTVRGSEIGGNVENATQPPRFETLTCKDC